MTVKRAVNFRYVLWRDQLVSQIPLDSHFDRTYAGALALYQSEDEAQHH
jgi:hypothetical protein